MKHKRLICAAWAAACLSLVGMGTAAHAAPINWHGTRVHVVADGQDLKDVLRDFTAGQGVPTTISSDVHGTVTGHFDMSPQRFLDTLSSTFGLVWFYDGVVLSISDVNSVTRQVIKLDHASTDDLSSALTQLHLDSTRFPIVYDAGQSTALVSGPAPYVQLVAEVAKRLDQNAGQRSGSIVRVFQLRHAWAADHKVEIDGKAVTVPGVASVLSGMYHAADKGGAGQGNGGFDYRGAAAPAMQRVLPMQDVSGSASGNGLDGSVNPPLPRAMPSTSSGGTGLSGLLNGMGAGGSAASGMPMLSSLSGGLYGADSAGTSTEPSGGDAQSLPVIEADPRTNSVLIRDVPQREGQYQALIDKLDVKPKLIEIEAHIIEIDDNALKQLGVDWRAHNSHADLQTGTGTTQQNGYNGNIQPTFGTQTLADGTTVIDTTPVGASLTAVLGNAGRYLLARIDALQQSNLARIDASPKVATLNNVEAVMDNQTRFFVRVSGYTSADLYSVSTGVSLRVLPLVVDENGRMEIKLDVHVEDGSLTGQNVDNIPIITTSTINTEAFVGQGESLLIGGYRLDSATNGETGVPGLSKIPLIGALFRTRNDQHSHMERLFLLSPRIIEF
jgi:type III secretion protein C